MKTALIFGVSGQDGAYLSRLLLDKGYFVHGTSRDAARQLFTGLQALGVRERVTTHSLSMLDSGELQRLIDEVRPDEIYNLAGLSSVALSFVEPEMARESIAEAQARLLEVLRSSGAASRLYQSASSECFGDLPHGSSGDERTPFAPRSPYAEAKAEAHRTTIHYRETYGLYAVSGIVCNHESPLRTERFVTRKIFAAAAVAAAGSREKLALGDMSASRDWGYAAEYVEAMWLMLQRDLPDDFVIATGESHTVEELASAAFAEFGLDYRDHVTVDSSFFRPTDLRYSRGNPSRARRELGWEARTRFTGLVRLLADAERHAVGAKENQTLRAGS
ncbi:MAG: GDP-mannose 4,6-dehydratase [Thermoanaerobaculia bacterium]|nr:GDP-mannose 4,6-dehydratase [Thermoanaerobaculia bacterium]